MRNRLDRIIKNGRVLAGDEIVEWDIGIRDGCVARLAPDIPPEEAEGNVVDAAGCWVLPGVVDAEVQLTEPGLAAGQGIALQTAVLAAGGVTSCVDLPFGSRWAVTDPSSLHRKISAAKQEGAAIDYALWAALVPSNLDCLEELHQAGAAGFRAAMCDPGHAGDWNGRRSADASPTDAGSGRAAPTDETFRAADDVTLLEGMARIAKLGSVLALHAENEGIITRLTARSLLENRLQAVDYARARPPLAEAEAVGRALLYAEATGCPVHFAGISTAAALERIHRAKAKGLNVSAGTAPHYLVLTEDDMEELGTSAKCAPPLRSAKEQEKLWDAVRTGRLELIASHHTPRPIRYEGLEEGGYFGASCGIAGGQSALELLVTEGTMRRGIPLSRISRLLSSGPARRLGLYPRKGIIAVGADADLVVLDPNQGYMLRKEHLAGGQPASPYEGFTMGVRVRETLCRGETVYRLGEDDPSYARGEWLKR